MSNTRPIDVPRLIRLATLLLAVTAGASVFFAYEPRTELLSQRLDDTETALRSDDVAFSEIPTLRIERDRLAKQYTFVARDAEAVFLRELASNVHRHALTLLSTTASQTDLPNRSFGDGVAFGATDLTLELAGSYEHLLAGLSEMSLGSEMVGVEAPSFRRDGLRLVATVPVTIYEPVDTRRSAAAAHAPNGNEP